MIDVIFLLLTFFIYNLLISTPVRVLPTEFTSAATGNRQGIERSQVLRVDKDGRFFLGNDLVPAAALEARLRDYASDPAKPRLWIQMDAKASFDRGPLAFNVIEYVTKAGINWGIVGRKPGEDGLIVPER